MNKELDIRKHEMYSCCRMNIEDLYKQLLEISDTPSVTDFSITPKFMAAPHNEMLFEGVDLYIKTNDGKIDVTGTVHFWHSTDGGWSKTATIHTFDTIEDCLEWLKNESEACQECTDILSECVICDMR